MLMETSNIIPSVSFQMTTHTTPVFSQDSDSTGGILEEEASEQHKDLLRFSGQYKMVAVGNIKISRTSLIYVPIKRTFPSKQSGFSLQVATGNQCVMELVVG